jgi:hypothetical protein
MKKDQCVVSLGGVGQAPHSDALGLRPHSGSEGEACKGRGETPNRHSRDHAFMVTLGNVVGVFSNWQGKCVLMY